MSAIEITEDTTEKVYEAIELARSTGKIKKGTNEVTKSIERGNAKFVVVAKDVSPPEIVMHLPMLCEEKGIPCVQCGTREELGASAGIDVTTVSISIVEEGEAKDLIKRLCAEHKKDESNVN